MGIKVKRSDEFDWPVEVLWPEDGEFVKYTIMCRFRRLSRDELVEPVKEVEDEKPGVLNATAARMKRVLTGGVSLQEHIVRKALVDVTDGLDVEDGMTVMEAVLSNPAIANAVEDQYLEAIRGGVREKN